MHRLVLHQNLIQAEFSLRCLKLHLLNNHLPGFDKLHLTLMHLLGGGVI
nr:MAG TPA: hypothetical protein [Caudoviricetes sp.]